MKKISIFLSAVLVFIMLASPFGAMEEVHAFPRTEIDFSEFDWYASGKAGESIYFGVNLSYSTAASVDVTGWKAALCPSNNMTLAAAIFTYDLTNENKTINDEYQYANVNCNVTLTQDIPEGKYVKLIFDAEGKRVNKGYSSSNYVNKTLVTVSCDMMNNDGYAYAYVYSESPALNASTYPTLYAADKTTALTTYNNYTVTKSDYGDTVHVYRLNILDKTEFDLGEAGSTYLYYRMDGTTVVRANSSDANGFGWTTIYDAHKRAADWGYEVKDPFATSSGGDATSTPENKVTGLAADANGNWYLYENGVVNTNYNGLYNDANVGWWLVRNGQVDFSYTGIWNDVNYGSWLIGGGAVAFDYTGLWYDTNYGWWLIGGGSVCFDYNGLWGDSKYGWWLIEGGTPAFNCTGLYCDANQGWWLIGGGSVAFGYTGLWYDANFGWWYVEGGMPAFGYTGLVQNDMGWWYVQNGTINFGYTGAVEWNGVTYNVAGGLVV